MANLNIVEVEYITPTKRRLLEARARKRTAPQLSFVSLRIEGAARVLEETGGQSLVVFMAVLSSYRVAPPQERTGFTVRKVFRDDTRLGDRQFRRGLVALEQAGYLVRDQAPGRKPRLTLTPKGRKVLAARA